MNSITPTEILEKFYKKAGWTEIGLHGAKETKFEMTFENQFDTVIINDTLEHAVQEARELVNKFINVN